MLTTGQRQEKKNNALWKICIDKNVRESSISNTNYDAAMSYYNGVKNNPDCISIEVTRLEDINGSERLEEVEIVASYS